MISKAPRLISVGAFHVPVTHTIAGGEPLI